MNNADNLGSKKVKSDQIDIGEIFFVFKKHKFILLSFCLVFAISSIFYALGQPNIYQATTVLLPANNNNGETGGLSGQIGGLASLAGISLGNNRADKTGLALEILKSRKFIETFIKKHNLTPPLMASVNWDMHNDTLQYDSDVYDMDTQKWLSEGPASGPSDWEIYKKFKSLVLVNRDSETGVITIKLSHFSPNIAREWLTLLIIDINETMRENDRKAAKNSIAYLDAKLKETKIADMQSIFYQLIEEQTKNMMLAEINPEYVLKTIDPPSVPDERISPKRSLIVIFGTVLGGLLGMTLVLWRHFMAKKEP